MASVTEAAAARTELAGDLAIGVDTLSLNQEITFTQYTKVVLPLDGYVFWVRSGMVSRSALLNAMLLNAVALNQPQTVLTAAPQLTAKGSLHHVTTKRQDGEATFGLNQLIFTSEVEVVDFNAVGPNTIYIAQIGAEKVKYAFSQRKSFYRQAQLYHYVGTALLPQLETQVVDDVADLDTIEPIVSNSLPLWLALNTYQPLVSSALSAPITLYPSYLVPDNLAPPYGTVHIPPERTEALQPTPLIGPAMSHDQLCKDQVRITLYGMRNWNALSFVDLVNAYSSETDNFGVMSFSAPRDDKMTQVELSIIAQKKSIDYEINYYQSTARNVARRLITQAIPTYEPVAPQFA